MTPSPLSTGLRRRLIQKLAQKQKRSSAKGSNGFTLIELLVVVVILGVLSAVGVPAYLSQAAKARKASAEAAVMGAAKSCAALLITGDQASFDAGDGVAVGTPACATGSTFTSKLDNMATQAVATVAANGSASLTTPAVSK